MLELGSYKSLPHYAVIGQPQEFYVYCTTANKNINSYWSGWIRGDINLYHKLKAIKSKKEFMHKAGSLVTERY